MTSTFVREQPEYLGDDWKFCELRDTGSVITILIARAKVASCEITFQRVVSYRCCLEEAATYFWQYFHKNRSETGIVYRVVDSDWLKAIDPVDLIHHKEVTHYLIVASEKKIDVAASGPPAFVKTDYVQ